ncbi:hypothetical protein EPN81_02415 [Patescibacteria group bacterium]|nr:MAG: hypothetical protein EPN81_02415 [Patescibacteria group bacterium]
MSLIGQSWELMCELAKRTPWGRIEIQPLIHDIAQVAPEFVRFLENGGRVMIQGKVFPTWKLIKLGLHKSPEAYASVLEAKGHKINKWARDILMKITCSQEVVDLELVDVSGAELGFTQVYTARECYERAVTFGLYPCPAETGPATRDQYNDQPAGEYRRIAMEAIADSGGGLNVFDVYRDGGELWLETDSGHPDNRWNPGHRWVFCRRKP